MITVTVPPPPPPVKLTLVQVNGVTVMVEVPYVNGRPQASKAAQEALFSVNPTHCRRANF